MSGWKSKVDRYEAPSRFGATNVLCAKAKRQQQDVGHEGVVIRRDDFSLRFHKSSGQGLGSLAFPLE